MIGYHNFLSYYITKEYDGKQMTITSHLAYYVIQPPSNVLSRNVLPSEKIIFSLIRFIVTLTSSHQLSLHPFGDILMLAIQLEHDASHV